ncbi:hypothetical protein SO802_028731 [Lithocarpus litseifolius]|uniref:Uncharacterized protein n=1 Tax=Lithocarpus litseifolius TaxID=425828 RepID=A0AAW2BTB6_9ROSI
MANQMFFVSFLVTLVLAIRGIHAIEYEVTNNAGNTPGGVCFNNEIGSDYSKQTLISATDFIWSLFKQSTDADRKNVPKVSLFIDDMDGVAYSSYNEIHVSARYINGFFGDVKTETTGVLYRESTHIWQWNDNGQNPPIGLIEGIADYVRVKAGLSDGFVAELNKKSKDGCSANFFVELLGKTVDQLWNRKNVAEVSLFIEDIDGVAYAVNNEIYEMTHIWQWNGNGRSPPGGLIEGIPDFVRLKSGYVPSHWVQPGKGDRWDQGYDVTAWFLDYLNGLRNGFVADLNKKLRTSYVRITLLSCLGRLLISSGVTTRPNASGLYTLRSRNHCQNFSLRLKHDEWPTVLRPVQEITGADKTARNCTDLTTESSTEGSWRGD